MGNQESSQFPYRAQEEHPEYHRLTNGIWKLSDGTRKDGTRVSIFTFDKTNQPSHRIELARNCMRNMKLLRHTNVLEFVDGAELSTHIHIVTEWAQPVPQDIFYRNPTKESGLLLSLGLHQILSGIAWLNNDCSMVMFARPAGLFQTHTGDWKLGNLDLLHKHSPEHRTPQYVWDNLDLIPSVFQSPEIQNRRHRQLEKAEAGKVEAWGVACLLHTFFNGPLRDSDTLRSPGKVPKSLQQTFHELIAPNLETRGNPKDLLREGGKFFSNPLVRSVRFLENLALASPRDKEIFFEKFTVHLEQFPDSVVKRKLLPLLLNTLAYGGLSGSGGTPQSLNSVLSAVLRTAERLLSKEEFAEEVLPVIVGLFGSKQRIVRVYLLQKLPEYSQHLTKAVVDRKIFPQVLTGFSDSTPALRELTVKSMVHLAPFLSPSTQDNLLLKHLSRVGVDPEPSIRTNTTYCLAKIAAHLSEKTRQRVLLPAFSLAAKDKFGPARVAAASCLGVAAQYFGAAVLARRVLACLGPLLVDEDIAVRKAALKSLETVVGRLRRFTEAAERAALQNPQQQQGSSASAASGGKHTAAVLGSAMSSISSSLFGNSSRSTSASPSSVHSAASAASFSSPSSSSGGGSVSRASAAVAEVPRVASSPGAGKASPPEALFSSEAVEDEDFSDWPSLDVTAPTPRKSSPDRRKVKASLLDLDSLRGGGVEDSDDVWGAGDLDGGDEDGAVLEQAMQDAWGVGSPSRKTSERADSGEADISAWLDLEEEEEEAEQKTKRTTTKSSVSMSSGTSRSRSMRQRGQRGSGLDLLGGGGSGGEAEAEDEDDIWESLSAPQSSRRSAPAAARRGQTSALSGRNRGTLKPKTPAAAGGLKPPKSVDVDDWSSFLND